MNYKRKIIDYGISCVDPLPNVEELRKHYETQYYQNANGSTSYDSTYSTPELDHKTLEADLALLALKESVNIRRESKISLLEFGCGEGFFLKQIVSNTDWDIQGIDFSKFGIEKWHPELLDKCIFGDSYDHLNKYILGNEVFDICVLRHVLEHVINPQKLLGDLRKILTKDGLLLITIPNDYSKIQMHAMKSGFIDNDFWFLPPDHLYYFNSINIINFVENNGYKVMDMFSSFPVDFFLFHPGSNYIKNKKNGKEAHLARINLDLLMAQSGTENLLNLYRAMAKCGAGRNITVILSPNN